MIGVRIMWGTFFWRTGARIAWRDLRASRGQSAFVLLTMAVSIAAVCGVTSAARAARSYLASDSRSWLASDVAVDTGEPISDAQIAALDRLRTDGMEWTMVTWVLTMAASDQSPDAGYIAVKAIDPAVYPFYGAFPLEPAGTARTVLDADSAFVSESTLERLQVRRGDTILIGGTPFRIAATYRVEPERYLGIYSFGMRCILSHAGYARAGIARRGNPPRNRILLRLPAGADLVLARKRLQTIVPEGKVSDYLEATRQELARVEACITFMSITAFLALLIGLGGVSVALRQHAAQSMGKLAVMKIVGGRSAQVAGIFAMQIAWMLGAAIITGMLLGLVTRNALLVLAQRYFAISSPTGVDWMPMLEGAALALAALSPLLAQPYWVIRSTRVTRMEREAVLAEEHGPLAYRLASWTIPGVVFLLVAMRMVDSARGALMLCVTLAGLVSVVSGASSLAFYLIERGTRFLPAFARQGLLNLRRPGNRTQIQLVALTMGFALTATTFLSAEAVVRSITGTMPYQEYDLILAGYEESQRALVETALRRESGVLSVETLVQARMRLSQIDGIRLEQGGWHVVFCQTETGASQTATVEADLAGRLGIHAGSRLGFALRNGETEFVVTGTRVAAASERFWFTIAVDCNGVEGLSKFYQTAIRTQPDRAAEVRASLRSRFPSFAVIAPDEVAQTLREVTANAALVVRAVALYAVAAGLCVLLAIVSSSRTERAREMAIYAALGASRRTLVRIYSVEFCALGLLAGAMGTLGAYVVTAAVLGQIFHRLKLPADWRIVLLAPAAVVLVLAAAWLPSYHLLRRKPFEVLRGE